MFLRNQWHVAAWARDIGRTPLARILLGEYVVLYRKQDGTPVAMENRCPHRNLPLSEGRLIGDSLECGYHGMVFDCAGTCTHVPGQAEIPAWARVGAYPVAERHGWLFIWMGDPALAAGSPVPDFHARLDDPDWRAVTGQTHAQCGYRLILDNLLDLSHLSYVHSGSTGNAAVAERAALSSEELADGGVRVTRWMADIPPAPAFVEYAGYSTNLDRWQISTFMPPGLIAINNGSVPAGSGRQGAARNTDLGTWGFQVYHAMTPETETTTHQFWAVAHPAAFVDAAKLAKFQDQMRFVLGEDLDVYEAQQRAIGLDPEAVGTDVNPRGTIAADEALLKMRRTIRRLYGAEQNAAKAA